MGRISDGRHFRARGPLRTVVDDGIVTPMPPLGQRRAVPRRAGHAALWSVLACCWGCRGWRFSASASISLHGRGRQGSDLRPPPGDGRQASVLPRWIHTKAACWAPSTWRGPRHAPSAGAREKAWIEATDAWLAGDGAKASRSTRSSSPNGRAILLAGNLGQLQAFHTATPRPPLRLGEPRLPATKDSHYVRGMHAFVPEEWYRIDEAETQARQAIEMQRKDPGHTTRRRIASRRAGGTGRGRGVPPVGQRHGEDCNSFWRSASGGISRFS